jgi:DNA-binding CsgD family transcriptional regulator
MFSGVCFVSRAVVTSARDAALRQRRARAMRSGNPLEESLQGSYAPDQGRLMKNAPDAAAESDPTADSNSASALASIQTIAPALDWDAVSHRLRLSKREAEIVALLMADLAEREIASQLNISAHTVHTHLERVYRKLQVKSRCALVVRMFHAWIGIGMPISRPDDLPVKSLPE